MRRRVKLRIIGREEPAGAAATSGVAGARQAATGAGPPRGRHGAVGEGAGLSGMAHSLAAYRLDGSAQRPGTRVIRGRTEPVESG